MKDSWSGRRDLKVTSKYHAARGQCRGAIEMPSHSGGSGGAGAPEQGAEVHAVAAEGLTDVFPPLQFPDQTPIWDGVVPDG